jgi:hypothetical protein
MASATKIADNGLDVKRHAAVSDRQTITAVFEEKPARNTAGARQPRATGIERTDTADETIGSGVSMAADDDIGVGSGEQWPELLIADPQAVVGSG